MGAWCGGQHGLVGHEPHDGVIRYGTFIGQSRAKPTFNISGNWNCACVLMDGIFMSNDCFRCHWTFFTINATQLKTYWNFLTWIDWFVWVHIYLHSVAVIWCVRPSWLEFFDNVYALITRHFVLIQRSRSWRILRVYWIFVYCWESVSVLWLSLQLWRWRLWGKS